MIYVKKNISQRYVSLHFLWKSSFLSFQIAHCVCVI